MKTILSKINLKKILLFIFFAEIGIILGILLSVAHVGESSLLSNNLEVSGGAVIGGGAVITGNLSTMGNVGIGTANPEATLQLNGTAKIFGSWVTKDDGTVYQAPTDGFVVAISGANGSIYGYTDSNSSPTTMMARNGGTAIPAGSITFPVRKNEYWRTSGASNVYWLPLGN